jgi:hypothetical protein
MASTTMTQEEFDARLAQSTEQMRQQRLALEAQGTELEELIGKDSALLERLKVGLKTEADQNLAARLPSQFGAGRHLLTGVEIETLLATPIDDVFADYMPEDDALFGPQ